MSSTKGRITESGFAKDWMVGTNDLIGLQIGETVGWANFFTGGPQWVLSFDIKWLNQQQMDGVLR